MAVPGGTLTGTLEGLAWFGDVTSPTPLAPSPTVELVGLSMVASRADITVHHVERYLTNDVQSQSPTRWTMDGVTAIGALGDARDARIVLLPGPDATVLLGPEAMRFHPAPTDTRIFPPRVSGGPDSVMETGSCLLVERGGDGLVEVRGSFRLVINGLDLRLDSQQGTRDLHTRSDIDGAEVGTPAGGSYAAHSVIHEGVLDLQDAVVRVPASELYVTQATVLADGPWDFRAAAGHLETPNGPEQVAGDIQVDGALDGVLRRHDGKVQATLSGSVAGVVVDGRFTAVAPWPEASFASPVLVAAVAGFAVLLAAGHVAVGRWRFGRLDHAMDRADYRNALGLSRGFGVHPRLAQDAALAAAICLLALGRPDDARARLQARSEWTVRRRPMRDFLLARAQAALGRRDEATRHLASSLMAEPSLLPQAQADPFLADVLRGLRPQPAEEAYA